MQYCFDISERKHVSIVMHGLLLRQPCVCCVVFLKVVKRSQLARFRAIQDVESAWKAFRERIEQFTNRKGSNEKNTNVKREGKREISEF